MNESTLTVICHIIYVIIYFGYFFYKINPLQLKRITKNIWKHGAFWKCWYIWVLTHYFFIQPMIDFEQVLYPFPRTEINKSNGFWPSKFLLDALYNYSITYDPLVNARPGWWIATVCISDVLQTFAALNVMSMLIKKQNVYKEFKNNLKCLFIFVFSMTSIIINTTTILFQEYWPINNSHSAKYPFIVLILNSPWVLFPFWSLLIVYQSLSTNQTKVIRHTKNKRK
eukprot:154034_1